MRQGIVNLAIAALAALVAGSIALVLCTQPAAAMESEWTWKVYPSDKVNCEAMQRMAMASVMDKFAARIEEMRAEAEEAGYEEPYYEPYYETYYAQSYDVPSDGLTASSGVNYHDGRTETYYSSNVLNHRDTASWTLDSEGFYRTDEGYYVVAASDMPQGTVFEGSKGECIVLDSGCADGVTDYYVNW